jgi:hypothetical protein
MSEIEHHIKTILLPYPNIHLLLNDTFEFNDYAILGTTLWTNIPLNMSSYITSTMNDYHYIKHNNLPVTVNHLNNLHYQNVKWLENQINYYHDKKILITTHHLPSFQLIDQKYFNHPMNYAFATDLEYLLKPHVRYFCCGHTHTSFNIQMNQCHLYINPKGYPRNETNENKDYNPSFTFNLE